MPTIMLATERRDLGLDDGSFCLYREGIPATEMFNVIPLALGHALPDVYGTLQRVIGIMQMCITHVVSFSGGEYLHILFT